MSVVSSQPIDRPVLNVVIEEDTMETSDVSYKVESSEQHTNFPLSEVSNDANTICYMNQDNTLSFINNPTVFQPIEDNCGEIYYACIGPTADISQQDQVLQLIPQTQISNYIISDKDYSNVNFISDPSILNGNNFYTVPNSNFHVSKYHFENPDSSVFKSINCIGKQICEICSLEFPSKRTYLKHMSIHENDREFKCTWCKLSYNYEVNLLVHVAIIHCQECTTIDEKTSETNYKCAVCSCLFSRKKAHQAHCLIHQVDEELPCEHCSSLFKCKILLEKHMNDHKVGNDCSEEKMSTNYLKCKLCHQIFNNVGNIKKHYVQFHPKNKEQWTDDVLPSNVDETNPPEPEAATPAMSNRRMSSKIACQTIKLYAQGKSKADQLKQESIRSINKRGRPKKTISKSSSNYNNCVICKKTFKTPILLRRHEVTHTGVKEFECAICKKGFTQKSSVKIHMVVHDTEKGFSCPFCAKRFTYEHNMNTHIKVIHKSDSDTPIESADVLDNGAPVTTVYPDPGIVVLETIDKSADIVPLESVTNASLTDDAEISQYLCNDTPVDHHPPLSEPVSSYQPNQSHDADNVYVPSTPNFQKPEHWETRGILHSEHVERIDKETGLVQLHEVIKDQVTGFKRFRCRFCFKLFRKSGDLTRHVRIHTQQRPFQCYLCHKTFRLKSVLKNHFKSHWKLKEYSCDLCDRSFNLKQTLKVHRQLHAPDKLKYSCKLCSKRFNTAYHWKYHLNSVHRIVGADAKAETKKITRAPKPVLPRTLTWDDMLCQPVKTAGQEHVYKLNQTPFKCNHCGKSYKFKKYLNEHLKDHLSANRTNICQFCHKSFLTFRSMQQHLRTQHLNRRKFSCPQCPAFFIAKASLIRHALVHSNSKPFACPLCFQRFKAKIYCDRHVAARRCGRKREARLPTVSGFGLENEGDEMQQELDDGDVLANDPMEAYSSFRLEDLDLINGQSSNIPNILVSNYVNEFSAFPGPEKYMIVSLDNKDDVVVEHDEQQQNQTDGATGGSGGGYYTTGDGLLDPGSLFAVQNYNAGVPGNGIEYAGQQPVDGVYYFQQEPAKGGGCLADKFPILKASLFADEDSNMLCHSGAVAVAEQQFFLTSHLSESQSVSNGNPPKLFHGCANCEQQFPDSQSLVVHVRQQHKVRRDFACNVCHKAFSAKLSLWAHSKTHIDSRSFGCFVCIACQQRFISVPSLSRHVRMQHNDNLNLYRCTHCGKVYKTTRELDSHVKQLLSEYDALIINPAKQAVDLDCEMQRRDQRVPHYHQRQQQQPITTVGRAACRASKLSLKELFLKAADDEPRKPLPKPQIDPSLSYPYSCSICHKGFNRASNLQQHLSVHTKSKPYQCPKCSNRFRHRCSLKTHEFTKHSPITKLLRCHLCAKLLRSQVALRNHMKIHLRQGIGTSTVVKPAIVAKPKIACPDAQEKMVKCGSCSMVFKTTAKYNGHFCAIHFESQLNGNKLDKAAMVETTQERLIKCLSCAMVFKTVAKYNNHYCTLRFEEEHERRVATAAATDEEEEKLTKCLACSMVFKTVAKYNNHYCTLHFESQQALATEDSSLDTVAGKPIDAEGFLEEEEDDGMRKLTKCLACSMMFKTVAKYNSHYCSGRLEGYRQSKLDPTDPDESDPDTPMALEEFDCQVDAEQVVETSAVDVVAMETVVDASTDKYEMHYCAGAFDCQAGLATDESDLDAARNMGNIAAGALETGTATGTMRNVSAGALETAAMRCLSCEMVFQSAEEYDGHYCVTQLECQADMATVVGALETVPEIMVNSRKESPVKASPNITEKDQEDLVGMSSQMENVPEELGESAMTCLSAEEYGRHGCADGVTAPGDRAQEISVELGDGDVVTDSAMRGNLSQTATELTDELIKCLSCQGVFQCADEYNRHYCAIQFGSQQTVATDDSTQQISDELDKSTIEILNDGFLSQSRALETENITDDGGEEEKAIKCVACSRIFRTTDEYESHYCAARLSSLQTHESTQEIEEELEERSRDKMTENDSVSHEGGGGRVRYEETAATDGVTQEMAEELDQADVADDVVGEAQEKLVSCGSCETVFETAEEYDCHGCAKGSRGSPVKVIGLLCPSTSTGTQEGPTIEIPVNELLSQSATTDATSGAPDTPRKLVPTLMNAFLSETGAADTENASSELQDTFTKGASCSTVCKTAASHQCATGNNAQQMIAAETGSQDTAPANTQQPIYEISVRDLLCQPITGNSSAPETPKKVAQTAVPTLMNVFLSETTDATATATSQEKLIKCASCSMIFKTAANYQGHYCPVKDAAADTRHRSAIIDIPLGEFLSQFSKTSSPMDDGASDIPNTLADVPVNLFLSQFNTAEPKNAPPEGKDNKEKLVKCLSCSMLFKTADKYDKHYCAIQFHAQPTTVPPEDSATTQEIVIPEELDKSAMESFGNVFLSQPDISDNGVGEEVDDNLVKCLSCSMLFKTRDKYDNHYCAMQFHTHQATATGDSTPEISEELNNIFLSQAAATETALPQEKLVKCLSCLMVFKTAAKYNNHYCAIQFSTQLASTAQTQEPGDTVKLRQASTVDTTINDFLYQPTRRTVKKTPKKKKLETAIVAEVEEKLIKCLSCSMIFKTAAKYNNHYCTLHFDAPMNTGSGEQPPPLKKVKKSPMKPTDNIATPETLIKCSSCLMLFKSTVKYDKHYCAIQFHAQQAPAPPDTGKPPDNEPAPQETPVNVFLPQPSTKKPIKCQSCKVVFKTADQYLSHYCPVKLPSPPPPPVKNNPRKSRPSASKTDQSVKVFLPPSATEAGHFVPDVSEKMIKCLTCEMVFKTAAKYNNHYCTLYCESPPVKDKKDGGGGERRTRGDDDNPVSEYLCQPIIGGAAATDCPASSVSGGATTVLEIPKKLIKCLSCSSIFNTATKYNNHYCTILRCNNLDVDQEDGVTVAGRDDGSRVGRTGVAAGGAMVCCGIAFASRSDLLRHVQITHRQIEQHNCAQCNISFAQESSFRNHQRSVHRL